MFNTLSLFLNTLIMLDGCLKPCTIMLLNNVRVVLTRVKDVLWMFTIAHNHVNRLQSSLCCFVDAIDGFDGG